MVKTKVSRKRIGVIDPSEEELYLKSAGISASGINTFRNDGPADFHYRENEDTDATVLGSAIHCLRYTPTDFRDRFSVIGQRVDGTMGQYLQSLAEALVNGFDSKSAKDAAYAYSGFKWPKSRVEDLVNKDKTLQDYLQALVDSHGKHVLSEEEKEKANQCLRSLMGHKKIQEITSRTEGEIWTERPIIWAIDSAKGPVVAKSKPDFVHIDHEKRIITIEDTKTTSKPKKQWKDLIKERGYFRQVAFYCAAVNTKMWQEGPVRPGPDRPYKWNAFISMVETSTSRHQVEVFEFDDKTLKKAFSECIETVNEIEWHRDNNLWDYPRDYYEGDGTTKLNIYS